MNEWIDINKVFCEKIKGIDENNMPDYMEFIDLFSQFMCMAHKEYKYNKTYFRAFYSQFKYFVRNFQKKKSFFDEFLNNVKITLRKEESLKIGFDGFFFWETGKGKGEGTCENRIPGELLNENDTKIYIEAYLDIVGQSKRYYAEEIDIKEYNEKNDVWKKKIDEWAEQFVKKLRG